MATHPSVLAWRIPGTGEPGGLPSVGSHRVGHDWSGLAAAATAFLLCPRVSGSGENSHSQPFLKREREEWTMQTALAFQAIVWGFVSCLACGSEHWCKWQFGFLVGTTEKHSKHPAFYGYPDTLDFHSSDLSALVFHSHFNMKFPVDIRCWVSLQVLLYHLHIFDKVFLYIFYSFLCNKLYF